MRTLVLFWLGIASLLSAGAPTPAAAGTPAALATPGATKTIFVPAFMPPLKQPLFYRLTKERVTPSSNERSVFEQQVVFEREGNGFVMQIKWLRVTVGARTYDLVKDLRLFPPEARAMFVPMAMELDVNGRPLRMRDWPRLRKALIEMAPLMARGTETDPAKRGAMETYFRSFMQHYAALSAEDAVNHMIQGWPPILGELGVEIEIGRDEHATMQAPTPFSTEPIDYDTTATWTFADSGKTLHLARRSIPSTESLRAVGAGMAGVARQITPSSKSMKPEKLERVFADMQLSLQTDIDFDRTKGLVRKAVLQKTVVAQSQTGNERITIEAM